MPRFAIAVVAIVACQHNPVIADELLRPAVLVAVDEARRNVLTAEMAWSVTFRLGNDRSRQFYRARISPDGYILENKGDDRGIVARDEMGRPVETRVRRWLLRKGELWAYTEGDLAAKLRMSDQDIRLMEMDVRLMGLLPVYRSSLRFPDVLWTYGNELGPRDYQQQVDGNKAVVIAKLTKWQSIRWKIDLERGCNVTEVSHLSEGEVVLEARSTLRQFGKTWFPETTAYYYPAAQPDPVHVVSVESASFNSSAHSRHLVPEDIGIESGLTVTVESNGPDMGQQCWTGSELIPVEEYAARRRKGEVKKGPRVTRLHGEMRESQRAIAAMHSPVVPAGEVQGRPSEDQDWRLLLRRQESAWERHVGEFIRRHTLSESQQVAAWSILKDCTGQADGYIRRMLETNSTTSQPDASSRLSAQLDKIFERQLKPRLESLLTAEQRRKASPTPRE